MQRMDDTHNLFHTIAEEKFVRLFSHFLKSRLSLSYPLHNPF